MEAVMQKALGFPYLKTVETNPVKVEKWPC